MLCHHVLLSSATAAPALFQVGCEAMLPVSRLTAGLRDLSANALQLALEHPQLSIEQRLRSFVGHVFTSTETAQPQALTYGDAATWRMGLADREVVAGRQHLRQRWGEGLKFMDRGEYVDDLASLYCFDTLDYMFRLGSHSTGLPRLYNAVAKMLLHRKMQADKQGRQART